LPGGPFLVVALGQGGLIQFAEANFAVQAQHYAFLVTEEFDEIYRGILDADLEH
jgi:hypothetical protein